MSAHSNLSNRFVNLERFAWIFLFAIWLVYSYLTFQTPTQQAMSRFGIDILQINLLRLSVILPVLFIWSAILYSFLKTYNYSQTIADSQDGRGFKLIANGIFCMLLQSAISSYISLGIQLLHLDPVIVKNLRIINNYIVLFFSLLSFYLIWRGSKEFIKLVKAEKKANKQKLLVFFTVLMLAIPYVYFVFQNPVRTVSNTPDLLSTYNLPDILIFTTIVIPYVISWAFGVFSIVNMSIFKEEIKGIIYKNVLGKFYKGFLLVIILVISFQYLTQFSVFLSHATLSVVLIMIYLILLIDGAGLIFVADGAKRLHKIEVV